MKINIDVNLNEENDNYVLEFNFSNVIKLSLSSNKTEELKVFFIQLIKEAEKLDGEITFNLVSNEQQSIGYLVSKDYLELLQKELNEIIKQMPKPIKD